MSEIVYKQLHQFHCGALAFPERSSLVSICPHGCFVCVSDLGLLLYDTKHYLEATGICKLRRDKPLPDHTPNIVVSSVDPIIWTAFNCDGLILAVLTSSESRGTFANLLNVVDLVKSGSTDLSNISRPVRVCGGETSLYGLRDFAWSPTDPTTFVVVLDSGAVRLFNFPPDGSRSITLVGQLPATADCRCVSWSPKGKQLAICLNGSLSTANGIMQGPLILQVDPQLQQKRIVPLGQLFESNHDWKNSLPVDLLWTSSYNYLLAIKQSVNEMNSDCLTNILYISTTSKSPEPSAVAIGNLNSHMDHNKVQYCFRFIGPNHVIVTLACVGEEVIVLKLPTAAGSLPQVVMSIELPADGCAMSMDVGVLQNTNNESVGNSLIYLLTYLSNGNICPYLLNSNDQSNLINQNNPKLISLPIPKPIVLSTTEKSPLNTSKSSTLVSASNDNPSVLMMANQAKQNVITSSVDSANNHQHHVAEILPVNTAICSGSNNNSNLQSITSSIPLNSLNNRSTESKLSSSLHKSSMTNSSVNNNNNNVNSTIIPDNKENSPHQCKTSINQLGDLPLPKSIQLAAIHFASALQLESEAGRHAWENLFSVLINGTIDKKSNESIGLDIIEARLHNVDRFFKAMNEVIVELTNALNERKEDLTNSINFGERLRRALRLYANGDWFHTISGHLDPETSRLFSQLKRRARLAEAGLYDLENQIESLSTELNTTVQSKNMITSTTIMSSPNQQRKEKLLTRNSVNDDSNIMRTIDTNANLIRAERGRIDFIVENLKRLGLSPVKCDSKCEKRKEKQKPMRKSLNSSNISFLKDSGPGPSGDNDIDDNDLMNPYRSMLIERDQALLRLFSNYKLPVIYPSKLCPSISPEGETVNDQSQSFSDVQSATLNHSQIKTTSSPGNMKNSKLEQLLVVSGEIASNTEVSVIPKTPSKPSTEKSVKVVNKTEAVPSSVSTPLSPNTPASVISSKPSNIAFNLTRNQIANSPTVSPLVNSAPVSNVKESDPKTTTYQQSFSLGMKSIQQPLFAQPNVTSAFTVSSTANNISNLFVNSTLFKPQSPSSSTLPIANTFSGGTSVAQSSAPFIVNNSKVSSPGFQKSESTITTNNSTITPVTTINETGLINSNPVLSTSNPLFSPSVIPKPIVTDPSNDFNNASLCKGTDEIKKENLVPNISSVNLPQTATVSSKSSGLFSFLPTPVCSSSGIMFGSGQSQNVSTATTNTTTSSSISSLFTGIPLNTTSTIFTNSDTTTMSNVTFNSKPLFGAPNMVLATTVASSTCSTGANIFLFGNPNQLSSTNNTGSVTTVSPANPVIGFTGTPISKSEAFNKTPTTSVSPLFSGTALSIPVSVPSCGIASNTHMSTHFGGSAPTTTIPASPMFGTTVFGKGTSSSGGLFTGTNVSSFQTTTSSSILQSPGIAGLFSVSNSVTTPPSLTSTATTIATTTSVTSSFSSPFGSSVFGGNSVLPGQSLFQNTTTTNTIATVSSSAGLFGTLAISGNKLFGSQPATQSSGFLFGSPFNAPVSGGGPNLFQVNTSNPTATVSSSTLFGASLFNTPSVNSPGNNNTTTVPIVPAQTTSSSLFSFVSGTSSLFSGASITSSQVNSMAPGTGLFAAAATVNSQQVTSNSTGGGAGLFGSPVGSDTKSTNSLFSVSSLSLGGNSVSQNPTQNAFGKPFGNTAFANQANSTLFGSPNSNTQNNIISGASPSLSNPQSGLFSSSILGSSLFSSPTAVTTMSGGGGGLFSNVGTSANQGTGLFGSQTPTTGVGGFGSSPTFGSPAFNKPVGPGLFGLNGPAAFNSSSGLFGSTGPVAGGPLFGGDGGSSNPTPVGGGLFASLGNKSNNLSFGSLAQNSPPGGNISASPFGTSPSFTQRRA
ncbi:unnamed protein product [Schistosoma rodhaini]|uniref:Nuclear pore complex protein Nup214 phenylalanine-glycine (FG) domain-containing protein n=2 Tax=Schistosoma rodhaini TaxID=6188 RepID=A0AA85FD45_9TREM|nr:unnamed protein product [Schistosoma rodhaini]